MILTTKITSGLSIYDYSLSLNGGFNNIIALIKLNPFLENINCDAEFLTDSEGNYVLDDKGYRVILGLKGMGRFLGMELSYDTNDFENNVPQIGTYVSKKVTTINQITGKYGQSYYDIALMAYGGFDNFIKLLVDNSIISTNEQDSGGVVFNFDTSIASDYALRNEIKKKGLVFVTGVEINHLSDEDNAILDDKGYRILL